MKTPARHCPALMPLLTKVVAFSFATPLPLALAAQAGVSSKDNDAVLGVMTWVEVRTIQTDPSLPVRVRLEGDSAQGQVLQLEQRGLVIYEQTLNDGTFRIREIPPLNDRSPLTVRLKSPSQEDQ